jgi:hypothetical protein
MNDIFIILNQLAYIDFEGKGESFIEAKFITPLLECLGYDKHKDYEVIRHGDEGSSFKLKYPPVEKGAKKVKHYNPDYIPTIRKKVFWIIEAKSPKDSSYPFDYSYIVQGLQYCIHPEIQARYMVLSNGTNTSIYDSHVSPFEDKDIYEPIFSFSAKELPQKWTELYKILSVEKMRDLLEYELQKAYEKLAYSSLDYNYPSELANKISIRRLDISHQIRHHVAELNVEELKTNYDAHQEMLKNLDSQSLFRMMDCPIGSRGKVEANYFIEKVFSEEKSQELFRILIENFEQQSIFRKEQTFVALCTVYNFCFQQSLKSDILRFLNENKFRELNLVNQVECLFLRFLRKIIVIYKYPLLRKDIQQYLETAPELIRFVQKPTALKETFLFEILCHRQYFTDILTLESQEIEKLRDDLEEVERGLEEKFNLAYKRLTSDELQRGGGLEHYGLLRYHYRFLIIIENLLE